jgi:hypothetical protein
MVQAILLQSSVYEEVEHDESLTNQALWVVVIASALSGLGLVAHHVMEEGPVDPGTAILRLAFGLIGTVIVYLVWAGITYYVGTNWLGGKADVGEMRRTIGFAASPRIIGVLVFLPTFGPFLYSLSWIWWFVAGVVAIKQGLDFSYSRAIGTVLLGWLVGFMVFMLVGMLAGVFTLAVVVPFM